MCKAMEDMRNESLREGLKAGIKMERKSTATRMLQAGKYGLEEIAMASALSIPEIKQLQTELG